MKFRNVLLVVVMFVAVAMAVPAYLNYQAKLTDLDGNLLSGPHDITFRIYDVETGPSSPLWSEIHYSVDVVEGFFSVRLGNAGSPLNLPFDRQYWIEIVIGTDVLSPREPLSTNAYAFTAANSELVNGMDVSDVFRITDFLYSLWNSEGITEDTVYMWGDYIALFHYYLMSRGWDTDTFEYFAEMADSLISLDFDSLVNWYADSLGDEFIDMVEFTNIDNGLAILFGGDTIGKAWIDIDSFKVFFLFNDDTSSMGFTECENGIAFIVDEDTLAWGVYEDYRFQFFTTSDTLIDLHGVEIPDGRALVFNDDTLVSVIVDASDDTLNLMVNNDRWLSLVFLNDDDGFGLLYDIGSTEDTLAYFLYDSLLQDILGFSDTDSMLNWYMDSLIAEYPYLENVDSVLTYYSDSLSAEYTTLLEWHLDSVVAEFSLNTSKTISSIPLWQAGAPYVMNNLPGQDLVNCESGLIPTVYAPDGELQVKLVVRVSANSAGSSNFQIRAHNGTTEVFPIVFGDMTWTAVQTGWIAESDWKDFSAGLTPWEVHLFGWVDSGATEFTSAYLLIQPK